MRLSTAFIVLQLLAWGIQGNRLDSAEKEDGKVSVGASSVEQSRELFLVHKQLESVAEGKILGGTNTNGQEYPFFVQADTAVSGFYCAGSLVAEDMVLSAAHCLDAWKSVGVLVGPYMRDSTSGPAQWREIQSELIVHPRYNSTTNENDFLMFKIEKVTLQNLKPITLNRFKENPSDGEILTAIGMGKNDDSEISQLLEKVELSVVNQLNCAAAYAPSGQLINEEVMLCTSSTGGKDTCLGDSGGPLFDGNGVQVGIVSFGGDPCADPALPGVYARVSGAIDWIDEQITLYSAPISKSKKSLKGSKSSKSGSSRKGRN